MIVVCDEPGLRVTEQDWSSLTVEVFPAAIAEGAAPVETNRTVFEKSEARSPHEVAQTPLRLRSGGGNGIVRLEIGAAATPRAWVVRIQLLCGQSILAGSVVLTTMGDGEAVTSEAPHFRVIEPATSAVGFAPFQGSGSAPGKYARTSNHSRLASRDASSKRVRVLPAAGAGAAVEVSLPRSGHGRVLELRVQ